MSTGTKFLLVAVTTGLGAALALYCGGRGPGFASQPNEHSVEVSWTASVSSISNYNVYRGTLAGGPYTIVGAATDNSTTYTDESVQAGHNYFYVVTAVDIDGRESEYSNEAEAYVPTP